MSPEDFATSFHNLEGSNLRERKKSLYILFAKAAQELDSVQIEAALNNLKPRHFIETVQRIQALIYFRKTEKLFEILKQGNGIFTSLIIKHRWFFDNVLQNTTPQSIVEDVLPQFSYCVRMKFLNRFTDTLEEDKVDVLYDFILKRYGLHIAKTFLHKCSSNKIQTELESKELTLSPNQTISIFKKNTILIKTYLEGNKVQNTGKLFRCIAQKNPELFLELREKHHIEISLGQRTSKRIVHLKKDTIINDIKENLKFLKAAVVVKQFHHKLEEIYLQVFPKDDPSDKINSPHELHYRLLKLYPKQRRWSVLSSAYQQTYGTPIDNNLTLLHTEFMTDMFPNQHDLHVKWAEANYQSTNESSYLKFYPTNVGIDMIKQKINVTSQKGERIKLIEIMIKNTVINSDFESLTNVLKYFNKRHRNEDANTRKAFLNFIRNNIDLRQLDQSHWEYIHEQFELQRIRDEFCMYDSIELVSAYIVYVYTKHPENVAMKATAIKQYADDMIQESKSYAHFHEVRVDNYPALEREILIDSLQYLLPNLSLVGGWMRKVNEFNSKNSKYKIYFCDFSEILNIATEAWTATNMTDETVGIVTSTLRHNILLCSDKPLMVFNDHNAYLKQLSKMYVANDKEYASTFNDIFGELICRKNRNSLQNGIIELLFTHFTNVNVNLILKYFLEYEPIYIATYLDEILPFFITDLSLLKLRLLKQHSYNDLDKRTIKYVLAQIESNERDHFKNTIKILSILQSTDDFIDFVRDKYIPTEAKLDLSKPGANDLYNLQCHAAQKLKNVIEPNKLVPIVFDFCTGDYFQSSLPTLYRALYNTPEKLVYNNILTLLQRPLSVKKHGIFLCCELLTQKEVGEVFKNFLNEKVENVSLQKHFLSAALKYFQKNPTQGTFDIFIDNIGCIDKNDRGFLNDICVISKIPKCYQAIYFEKIWRFFEQLELDQLNITRLLQKLIARISREIVPKLNRNFYKNIIETYFIADNKYNLNLNKLILYRLLPEVKRDENFEFVFPLLHEGKKFNKTPKLINFFDDFIAYMQMDRKHLTILDQFKKRWNSLFTIEEAVVETVILELFTCLTTEVTAENTTKNVENVMEMFEKYLAQFGTHFFYIFQAAFNRFFQNIPEYQLDIVLKILQRQNVTIEHEIFAINLIQTAGRIKNENSLAEILKMLDKSEHKIVKVLYNQYCINK